jgi:peptide/nickel transport system substrate-binding protein
MADAQYFDAMLSGNFNAVIFDHCGSLYDPWQTLEHFHSKYAPAAGARGTNVRAISRYRNPELDAILEKMEARKPSPSDPDYMALVKAATAIVLRDVPEVTITEELHTLVMNNTYWTGWPSAADPYIAPYSAWDGFELVVAHLKPRQ